MYVYIYIYIFGFPTNGMMILLPFAYFSWGWDRTPFSVEYLKDQEKCDHWMACFFCRNILHISLLQMVKFVLKSRHVKKCWVVGCQLGAAHWISWELSWTTGFDVYDRIVQELRWVGADKSANQKTLFTRNPNFCCGARVCRISNVEPATKIEQFLARKETIDTIFAWLGPVV